ncbi:MAG: sodium:solute symporter family protein [Parachlamydiaceae bacterium]|nr:sodium:solute symporter family protein [Parachlamydiaceae bacterium]
MNISVFVIALFVLQAICLVVGHRAAKKLSTQDDYFLAGRGIRFFPLLMTLIATQIGGGLILGSAEEAYRYGWYVLFYPLGACLGLLLLAAGIGKRLSQFKVSTIAQLFEEIYQSVRLKKVASILSIISLFMILIAQVIASKKFLISLGVTQNWIFAAFWAIVIIYTVTGGLKAVVATDIIQALFFISVFVACFVYSVWSEPALLSQMTYVGSGEGFDFDQNKVMGWLLMPLLFMVIEQDMAQRCFAAKSGKVVSWASGCSALCIILVCAIPVFYGILGKAMGLHIPEGSSVLMTVLMAKTTPVLSALFGCAIVAAVISTADSLMNAISSNIAQDFNFKWSTQKNGVKVSQAITCGIGCLALLGSFFFSNVVGILIISYELSVSCLFVPVFAALFIRSGNPYSATGAVVLGAAGFVLFQWMPVTIIPKEIASLLLSLTGYLGGELYSRISAKTSVEAQRAKFHSES